LFHFELTRLVLVDDDIVMVESSVSEDERELEVKSKKKARPAKGKAKSVALSKNNDKETKKVKSATGSAKIKAKGKKADEKNTPANSEPEEASDYAEEEEMELKQAKPPRKKRKISEEGLVHESPPNSPNGTQEMKDVGFNFVDVDVDGNGDDEFGNIGVYSITMRLSLKLTQFCGPCFG